VFARQVENIKEDAHERLKIGTKKADVARFFAELSIPLTISESEARGTLWTSGCAPFGCGSDPASAVTEEPTVIGIYTDCLQAGSYYRSRNLLEPAAVIGEVNPSKTT
jgi:hypothetical protein